MSGLFIKDLRLLLQRKQTVILFLVVAIMVGLSQDGYFSIGYMTILCVIYSLSTISFDEVDNGYPFLMTLPISIRDYVVEKYIFCSLAGLIGWTLSLVVFIFSNSLKESSINILNELPEMVIFIPILMFMCSIQIPLQLKYGAEKSRIVFLVLGGGIAVAGVAINKLFDNVAMKMDKVFEKIDQMSEGTILAYSFIVVIILWVISLLASIMIMKKKEF